MKKNELSEQTIIDLELQAIEPGFDDALGVSAYKVYFGPAVIDFAAWKKLTRLIGEDHKVKVLLVEDNTGDD